MYWRIDDVVFPFADAIITTTSTGAYRYYDPDKYDLVEKKDYKIKELKKQIEVKKTSIELAEEVARFNAENANKHKEELKKLEQELKELEK